MTTGLFRWKPDYENGSMKFEAAGIFHNLKINISYFFLIFQFDWIKIANLYRDGKAKDKAILAFKRAGEAFEKLEL